MNPKTQRILVIDDERPTLKMFTLLLAAMGYDVLTAEDGEQGLAVFREKRPEIILTDIKMPIMDGIEVLKSIKELNPHAEVVIITGHGDMELAIKSLNLDATDFINKPVNRDNLEKALARATERLNISRREDTQVRCSAMPGGTRIDVRGNVSALTVPSLREAFVQARREGGERIQVVFERSTSINGAGITALAEELGACREAGFSVTLAGLSTNFETVFEMVGITRLATMTGEPPASGTTN